MGQHTRLTKDIIAKPQAASPRRRYGYEVPLKVGHYCRSGRDSMSNADRNHYPRKAYRLWYHPLTTRDPFVLSNPKDHYFKVLDFEKAVECLIDGLKQLGRFAC